MHNASSFASASQSVSQTTSFIGSASRSSCRDDEGVPSFTEELVPLLQLPAASSYASTTQMMSVTTIVGASYSTGGQGTSTDSLMQLLQGLESEIAQLAGQLNASAGQASFQAKAATGTGNVDGSTGSACSLRGDYATLYNEAVSEVQDGGSFNIKLPSGETFSGQFSSSELEVAGSTSLFTPGDPSAPDAGKQAFENSLDQFLELAQSDSGSGSAAGQIANYTTNTSFTGTNSSIAWTGSFSLAPADAIPKS